MSAKLSIKLDDARLKTLGAEAHRGLSRVVTEAASAVQAHAQDSIRSGPKTGRLYELGETEVSFTTKGGDAVSFTARKGQAAKQHQASAPGEAPANEIGNLADSIFLHRTGDLAVEVVAPAEYAAALEFGTEDGKIAPRPFLGPALEHVREPFLADVVAALARAAE